MFKRNVVSLAVLTTLIATSASAATKKDDQEDSVSSWGPWNGVQTAAGPGAGAATVPLLLQFSAAQNATEGSAFEAGVENDNSGLRQYQAWTSRKAHDRRNSTEQAYFTEFSIDYPGEGEKGEATFTYAIATDAGDQTRNPRVAVFDGSEGGFISIKNKGKSKEIVKRVPVSEVPAKIYRGGKLPPVGTVVVMMGPPHVEIVPGPMIPGPMIPGPMVQGPMVPGPMIEQVIPGANGRDTIVKVPGPMVPGPMIPGPMVPGPMVQGPPIEIVTPGTEERMLVVRGDEGRDLQRLSPTAQLVVQQQTHERNVQLARIEQGDKEGTFAYGVITGTDEERDRALVGVKDGKKWLFQSKWSKWSGWSEDRVNNQSNFIYGQSSSIASVNSVLSGAQNLSYAGNFVGSGGYVELTLKLGAGASWEGTFNPGNEVPSFRVENGSFNGVDLTGAVTANRGIASGTVDASFFGNSAQHIAGIADVSGYKEGDRFVDVFTTTEGVVLPD